MRIAFYAPMKAPDHPVPSGDRTIARGFIAALTTAGHQVRVVSTFTSRDPVGDRQPVIAKTAAPIADTLTRELAGNVDLWFTYHLFHKAPDHLGPPVSDNLGLPYVVAEASYAPKQANGPWAVGHAAVAAALHQAAAVITLNPDDEACVRPLLSDPGRLVHLPPFLATDALPRRNPTARRHLAARWQIDPSQVWLATAAMMRRGDKQTSYDQLAKALTKIPNAQLLVAGDGPARGTIAAQLRTTAPGRITLLGVLSPPHLADLYAAADLLVWPAYREAIAMTVVEAQAAGLPVVAGASGAIPSIVAPSGRSPGGVVVPSGDTAAFVRAANRLIDQPALRRRLGRAARANAAQATLAPTAKRLNAILAMAATT